MRPAGQTPTPTALGTWPLPVHHAVLRQHGPGGGARATLGCLPHRGGGAHAPGPAGGSLDRSFEIWPDGRRLYWNPPASHEGRPGRGRVERVIEPPVVEPRIFEAPRPAAVSRAPKSPALCPEGHELQPWSAREGMCDGCWRPVKQHERVMDCRRCNWYLCGVCLPQHKARPSSLWGTVSALPFYVADDFLLNDAVGALRSCIWRDAAAREANVERAEQVLRRQAAEGKGLRDLNPKWFLDAVLDASPSMVSFVQRKGDLKTMGVEVFADHPDKDALEIYAMFGPGMGDELFKKAALRAKSGGRRDLVANVSPGAREAYAARGFKAAGPVAEDKTRPMRRRAEDQAPGRPALRRSRSAEHVGRGRWGQPLQWFGPLVTM